MRAALAALAAVAALTGCNGPTPPTRAPSGPPSTSTDAPPTGGYSRAQFGQAWRDVDRDGCDQRNDALGRDLTDVVRQGRCVVLSGTLTDPYSGEVVPFTKAHADDVQIDHTVALSDAWKSGADAWTPEQREQFANDLSNLVATKAAVNRAKSDYAPGEWRFPDPGRWCTYLRRYAAVKTAYGLRGVPDLSTCPA